MTVTPDALRTEVGAGAAEPVDVLNQCISVAEELLAQYAGSWWTAVPTVVQERAWLVVAAEIFNQRNAPNGVLSQVFPTADGTGATPVRIGADPLRPAYPLLQHYKPWEGFA